MTGWAVQEASAGQDDSMVRGRSAGRIDFLGFGDDAFSVMYQESQMGSQDVIHIAQSMQYDASAERASGD